MWCLSAIPRVHVNGLARGDWPYRLHVPSGTTWLRR